MAFDPVKLEDQISKVVNTVATILITVGTLLGFEFLTPENVTATANHANEIVGAILGAIGVVIAAVQALIARYRKNPQERLIRRIVQAEMSEQKNAA